jgi:hypothetical protein
MVQLARGCRNRLKFIMGAQEFCCRLARLPLREFLGQDTVAANVTGLGLWPTWLKSNGSVHTRNESDWLVWKLQNTRYNDERVSSPVLGALHHHLMHVDGAQGVGGGDTGKR